MYVSLLTQYVITGPLLYWRPSGILVAFPVVAYGFTTHHFLFTIYASLKTPSPKRVTLVAQKVGDPSEVLHVSIRQASHVGRFCKPTSMSFNVVILDPLHSTPPHWTRPQAWKGAALGQGNVAMACSDVYVHKFTYSSQPQVWVDAWMGI